MALNEENLTAILYKVNDLRLEHQPISEPNDDEVLLQMEVVGICGTDIHLIHGVFPFTQPIVIGHESAGTVVKVGKNVQNLKPGDRVAVEPGIVCGHCKYCSAGRRNLCETLRYAAAPPTDGSLRQYFVYPANFCLKLPNHVSLEEGALLQPLSIGVHACEKGRIYFGSIVLVLGAGPIGLITLLVAKALGASKVIITDIVESKLSKAKELGADITVLLEMGETDDVTVEKIKATGYRPTVSIDCVGMEATLRTAIRVTQTGGRVVAVGIGKPNLSLPVSDILMREIDLVGIFRCSKEYPTALEMIATGKLDVKPLITHNYKISELLKALDVIRTGEGDPIKVLIHTNSKWQPE